MERELRFIKAKLNDQKRQLGQAARAIMHWREAYTTLLGAKNLMTVVMRDKVRTRHKISEQETWLTFYGKQVPPITVLCGSTRFHEAFVEANLQETLAGKMVLSIGCDTKSDHELFSSKHPFELQALKERLDELHLRKIDMADEVYILNVGGYIGESTRRELEYALSIGKKVRFLEVPESPFTGGKHGR